MDRQLISSGAAFEDRVGYSRAVRVGNHVWVSGTAPIMPGDADPPAGAYEQAGVCLEILPQLQTLERYERRAHSWWKRTLAVLGPGHS